ncbi:MAG: leucine-rich repeat domain-containing protein, partial [Actinomycetota bacterium]|nr:leucine-rich repeat domain-containing protein [Actinomycetota bacterium]
EITSLADAFSGLGSLQHLYLKGNAITSLADAFSGLSTLQELYLGNNALTGLAGAIAGLSSLHTLELNGNALDSIPDEIFTFPSLHTLDLRGNVISRVPDAISMPSRGRGALWDTLRLDGNRIATVPAWLAGIAAEATLFTMTDNPSWCALGIGRAVGPSVVASGLVCDCAEGHEAVTGFLCIPRNETFALLPPVATVLGGYRVPAVLAEHGGCNRSTTLEFEVTRWGRSAQLVASCSESPYEGMVVFSFPLSDCTDPYFCPVR